jgi:murein DD-endopeptidase MepM/ murein hydrolase activator NlpD
MKSASIANSRRSYVATAEAIDRLESQVAALKHNPWQLEREINNLLKALNAEPETERDYLKERLFTIAATVMLTAATMKSLDTPISKLFSPSTLNKTEQVQPSETKGLDKPLVKVAPIIAKPDANPKAKPDINQLMQAIASQESGGNHELINSDSGASGKWQVMPENIPSWSKAALGREISQAEFIGSAQIQQQIVRHRLNLYLNQQQPDLTLEQKVRMAASAWYSGQPELWNNTKPQYSNGREYPSIAEYTVSVWNLYQSKTPKFSETKAIISTWSKSMQEDPKAGDMIAGYPVSSPRGMRVSPTTGTMKMHQGVDLAIPVGTPVFAIADGEIECDYWLDAGIVAMFTSDSFPGLRFDLLHLSKCNGKSGLKQAVKKGDVIGLSGSYGTGPHLHLAIKSQDNGSFLRVRSGWLYWFITGQKP